jgi:hypothetical protein
MYWDQQNAKRRSARYSPGLFLCPHCFPEKAKSLNLHRPATMMMPRNEKKILKESGSRQDEHELGETVALDVAAPTGASGVAHPFLLRSFGA